MSIVQFIERGAALSLPPELAWIYKSGSQAADLDIDFVNDRAWNGGLIAPSSLLTVSRASTKMVVGSNGYLTSVANNTLAFDHDPVTLAPLGLLIEGARTNFLTWSGDLTNAAWGLSGATRLGAQSAFADGQVIMAKLIEDSSTGQHQIQRTGLSVTSAKRYIYSMFFKAAERSKVHLQLSSAGFSAAPRATFDLSAVTATISVSGNSALARIANYGSGIYRCEISAIASSTSSAQALSSILDDGSSLSYTGNGTSGIYACGGQFEESSFGIRASSYIPTTSGAVSRAADSIYMPVSALAGNPRTAGTLFVRAMTHGLNGTVSIVGIGLAQLLNDANNRIGLRAVSTTTTGGYADSIMVTGGATQADTANIVVTEDAAFKATVAWGVNDLAAVVNGSTPNTNTSYTFPPITNLSIGGLQGQLAAHDAFAVHVQSVRYLARRAANTELQSMTA